MTTTFRISLLLACLTFLVGCEGEEERASTYAGDPSAAIIQECEAHEASGLACDGDCILARLNASCPMADDMWGDPELDSYQACVDTCATTLECTDGRVLRDCQCTAACAAARSPYMEGLIAHHADCLAGLAECQG